VTELHIWEYRVRWTRVAWWKPSREVSWPYLRLDLIVLRKPLAAGSGYFKSGSLIWTGKLLNAHVALTARSNADNLIRCSPYIAQEIHEGWSGERTTGEHTFWWERWTGMRIEKVKGQKNKRGVLAIGLFPIGVSTTLISLAMQSCTTCLFRHPKFIHLHSVGNKSKFAWGYTTPFCP
jgi:hypothetical protein